jgi:hypothetical protein
MSIQKGTGIVWSLVTALSGTVFASGIVESVEYELMPETDEKTYGADGKIKNRTFSDVTERITVTVIPTGATIAAAKSSNVLPAIGADITVTDADDTEIAGSGSSDGTGTYIFVGGNKSKQIRGKGTLRMTLDRHETHLATVAAS